MKRYQVELPIEYYALAERIVRKKMGSEPRKLDVLRFCRDTMKNGLDKAGMIAFGIDENGLDGIWWNLYRFWLRLGLWQYKGTTPDVRALESGLDVYGIDGITGAMENYAEIALKDEYYPVERMDFDEFMVRGVDDFVDSNDPLDKYKRVTVIDLARQLKTKKDGPRVKVNYAKLKKIRIWLDQKVGGI